MLELGSVTPPRSARRGQHHLAGILVISSSLAVKFKGIYKRKGDQTRQRNSMSVSTMGGCAIQNSDWVYDGGVGKSL